MMPLATPSSRGVVAVSALILALVPLVGFSKGVERGEAGAKDVDVPPIYVAQTLVFRDAGEPVVERSYRQALKACHDAGMATTALSEDDAKKLGRTYFQLWFDDRRSAWREDAWDFTAGNTPADGCQFHVTHEANKVVDTAQEHLSIDLMAGTSVNEASVGFMPGGNEGMNDDDQLDANSAQLGYQRLGYATDAGQRCLRWRHPGGDESCVWSEGHAWGFTRGAGSTQAISYDPGIIVLWVHPAEGSGPELTTQKMTVGGQPFDDALFEPPPGATVEGVSP